MRRSHSAAVGTITLFLSLALLSGCFRDPNVRKHKYLESGQRYEAQGKDREAAIQYWNALKIDKNFADAHYALAQAYLHMGAVSSAFGELKRTVDLQPTNYKARIELGNMLLGAGKIDDAQAQANAVVAAQPNNADVHGLLARIAAKRGQTDVALNEIHRALQLAPNEAELHETLALLVIGDPAQGALVESELKKAAALETKSVSAKLLLTAYYVKNSRWAEAVQTCQDAIRTDPKNLAARETLAEVYLKQGNQAQAEQVLRQASSDLADDPRGVQILADYYVRSGQTAKATAEFQRLAQKYPKNLSLQEGYVRALLGAKDYATAQTVVAGLMKTNGKDPEVAALNGIVLLNNGKPGDAVVALQAAASNAPKDVFTQFWLGRAALAKGDADLAEKSFRQAVQLNPRDLEARVALAEIASQRGDMSTLSDLAGTTIAAAPRFAGGYLWRAAVELHQNLQDKAEADLKTAIGDAPQNPQAYLMLGELRFAQKRYPEGAALLEKTLQLDPNALTALRELIGYDLLQKQPARAIGRVNAQIAKSPANSGLYDMLAQLQIQNKNLDQASATAQKAIQMNPNDGEAVILYAQLQAQRGQVQNAEDTWKQWLKAHPDSAGAVAILGTLEDARGDWWQAENYYKQALQLKPGMPIAANNLAYLMLEHGGNVDVALTLAQTARQGMPNSPTTADTLAWAYYNNGTYGFARDLLEDAIKIDPKNADMQYHLGMVCAKMHDKAGAEMHLKKAISLSPNSSTAKEALAALHGLG